MIIPAKENHDLFQGTTWIRTYVVKNEAGNVVDISGCTAHLTARVSVEDDDAVLDIEGQVTGVDGKVFFQILPANTIGATWQSAVFDAELYWPGGRIDKICYGAFNLIHEVTRE